MCIYFYIRYPNNIPKYSILYTMTISCGILSWGYCSPNPPSLWHRPGHPGLALLGGARYPGHPDGGEFERHADHRRMVGSLRDQWWIMSPY